jgi:hypothetical protein
VLVFGHVRALIVDTELESVRYHGAWRWRILLDFKTTMSSQRSLGVSPRQF